MISDIKFLDRIEVAAPCSASWEQMQGDERKRHCDQCRLNVYNLSEMSRNEAEALIRQHEGRLCIRLYRRADGTVITDNCPLGLRAIRNRILKQWSAVAAAFVALLNLPLHASASTEPKPPQAKFVAFGMAASPAMYFALTQKPKQNFLGKLASYLHKPDKANHSKTSAHPKSHKKHNAKK